MRIMNNKRAMLFLAIALISIAIFGIGIYSMLSADGGAAKFYKFTLGGKMPLGEGATTFAPELEIPPSKFYLGVAQKNVWCAMEYCGPIGDRVAALGGWLQAENTKQPEIEDQFGLYDNEDVESLVLVGDKNSRLVGIYPNKTIDDLPNIMEIHRDLWQ